MSTVSHSEADSYLLCKRKHYYGYGLSLQSASTSTALAMGTAGHSVLETFYRAIYEGESFASAKDLAETKLKELYSDGYTDDPKRARLSDALFDDHYGYFAQEVFVQQGWEILAVEQEFKLTYDEDGNGYAFVVDLIARDPQGQIVIIDHKFQYDFTTDTEAEMLPQIPKYIGALRGLGYRVSYGAFNQIRTRKIVGTKSKAHPDGAGPTPEQAYFFYPMRPNPARVKRVFIEQTAVAREIGARKELPIEEQERTAWRVASKMVCKNCDFLLLCSTELSEGNTKLVLETEYKPRVRRAPIEESEEAAA